MIGEIKTNTRGTDMRIIRMRNKEDIDVQFLDDFGYVAHNTTYSNFNKGWIKNPYDPTVYGVGYIGAGKYPSSINGRSTVSYDTWHNIIRRCYAEEAKSKFPAYYDICKISKRWHDYQNFAQWYEENVYEVNERLHIDKDILYPGNKIYCPDTCLLVPQRINMMFTSKPNKRGLPNGISSIKNGYSVKYGEYKLGTFLTLEEAFEAYVIKKKECVLQVANEYKKFIPDKLYQALINYDYRIDVDKNYMA